MSVDAVKHFLESQGLLQNYLEFPVSSATVSEAARAIGCNEGNIAKTLAFDTRAGSILIVLAGTARIDNKKFKAVFGQKPIFPAPEMLAELIGHPAGGVCPFAINGGIPVFLDESLRAFDPVYPAAGATNNAVRLTIKELERTTNGKWVNVSKS